jgi:surfeit locus 1 family protein
MRLIFKPFPVLTLLAIPALALLLVLGSWQWERFDAKRTAAPPVDVAASARPLAEVLASGAAADRVAVEVSGTWQPGTVRLYALQDGKRGARLISPLATPDGTVLVDRGWVSEAAAAPDATGPASLTGLLRSGAKPNRYTPGNDPAAGAWYWPDIAALGEALSVTSIVPDLYLAPLTVDPLGNGQPQTNPWADPRGADLLPAERHLGYALTWWGLAAALVGVWIALHVRVRRLGWQRG